MSEINLNYNLHVIGNPNYCRSLANMSTFTNFFDITGGVDYYLDCPNDDFRLSSVLFKSRNPEEVIQIGHELVELFNSLNKLLFPTNFRRLPLVIDEILNVISWNAIHFVLGFTFLQVLCLIFLDRENFK